jgi:hypothetical protein
MKVELLHMADCPNTKVARRLVKEALRVLGLCDRISEVEVSDPTEPERLLFPGSPTIRVDDIDVEKRCGVCLLFLLLGGASEWKLPLALAVTVLVSSYVIHIQTMWRQAPITAAIVIAAGLTHHSKVSGVEHGLHKVGEVILGCVMGLFVSWIMSEVWPLPELPVKAA